MAFQFRKKEAAAQGIRRMAGEQIRLAQGELRSTTMDPHEAIHAARKRFKKIRALLRLARPGLGSVLAEENAAFRDLGRALSPIRDAEAMIETFEALSAQYPGQLPAKLRRALRKHLVARREQLVAAHPLAEQVREVGAALEAAAERVPLWPLEGEEFPLIAPGLRRIYRNGARAMKQARGTGAEEAFHEWRKRVKDHWYQVRMLRGVWPELLRGYSVALNRLSDQLGDHHNLAVFRAMLVAETLVSAPEQELLLGLADRERQRLEQAAKSLGQRVYAENAAAFTERMGSYWDAWRAELPPGR